MSLRLDLAEQQEDEWMKKACTEQQHLGRGPFRIAGCSVAPAIDQSEHEHLLCLDGTSGND